MQIDKIQISELCTIGAILSDGNINDINHDLKATDFSDLDMRACYEAAISIKDKPITEFLIAEKLKKGKDFLDQLQQIKTISRLAGNLSEFSSAVVKKALEQEYLATALALAQSKTDNNASLQEKLIGLDAKIKNGDTPLLPISKKKKDVVSTSVTPTDFVIAGLKRGTVGIVAGQGAVGKGMMMLGIVNDISTGKNTLGMLPETTVTSDRGVAFVSWEDDQETLDNRLRRIESVHKHGDPVHQFDVVSVLGLGYHLVEINEYGTPKINRRLLKEMGRRFHNYRLIVIDTLSTAALISESKTEQAVLFMESLKELAKMSGAAVVVVHHLTKGADVEIDRMAAIRGSGALVANARWAAILREMSSKEAAASGMVAADHRVFDLVKSNLSGDHSFYFKRVSEGVFGGCEKTPVVVSNKPMDPVAALFA